MGQAGDGIGASRRRAEDARLITGRGDYADDITPANACFAAIVRSPHAHAVIGAIDSSGATGRADVLAVLTGKDAAADGLGPIPHNASWRGAPDAELRAPPGFEVYTTEHLVLAIDRVRHVGEPVAIVVAETEAGAIDAAERVHVEYEELPASVDARAAMKPGAPLVWPGCESNVALSCETGDREATEAAFARAAHVVAFDGVVNRVTGAPMEPRAATGEYDPEQARYTLRAGSGSGVVRTRDRLATVLGVPEKSCRVVFGDMGGNFGTRNAFAPEWALLPWVARRVGRPVKWRASRLECFLSDYQARDFASNAELALDEDGYFIGLRGENVSNLGAQTAYFWPLRKGLSMMQGVYHIPSVYFKGHAVLTHTMPTAVYRSAGRPEAIYIIERLIELAAAQCGFDRISLRRKNLIKPQAMPYTNGVGATYDSGDYPTAMGQALRASDWQGFPSRRTEAGSRGRCRGIGIANYIEITSGFPLERAELSVGEDGLVELAVGTTSSGQGHETSFVQLIADGLAIPFEQIRYVANDTDRISVGGGSHSGRSMRLVSIVAAEAVGALIERGRAVSAHLLQTEDVSYSGGRFVAPSGASVDLGGVARAAITETDLPAHLRGPFEAIADIDDATGGYPYGSHVCEVEVDPHTGTVDVVAWTGVDDVGLAVNPMILHGQAHGAVAQGLGQALCEEILIDRDTGQPLTATFMDYAMPRASTVPPIATVITETPATSHPYGIRPGGEGGTTPALAALVNAVVDALSQYGVTHVDLPTTPERVWRALQDAQR